MSKHGRNAILAAAPVVAFPSILGLALCAAVMFTLYSVVPRLDAADKIKRKSVSALDLVVVLESLVLGLSAGLSIPASLKLASASRHTIAHRQLSGVVQLYEMGQDLPTALIELTTIDGQWTLICGILAAAHLSGAPVVEALDAMLEHLREEAQSEVTTRIRSLAVKSVLPLGLCFLPAFFLLTVVPLVASFLMQVHW